MSDFCCKSLGKRRERAVATPRERSEFLHELAKHMGKSVRTVRRYCERKLVPGATRTPGGHWSCKPRSTMSRSERVTFLRQVQANIKGFERCSRNPLKGLKFGKMTGENLESEVAHTMLLERLYANSKEPWPESTTNDCVQFADEEGEPIYWAPPEGPSHEMAVKLDALSQGEPAIALAALLKAIAARLFARDNRVTEASLRAALREAWPRRKVRCKRQAYLDAVREARRSIGARTELCAAVDEDGAECSREQLDHGKTRTSRSFWDSQG